MNNFFSLLFSKYTWTTPEKESRDQKLFKTNRQCGRGRPKTLDFSIELIDKNVLVEEIEWKGSQENN